MNHNGLTQRTIARELKTSRRFFLADYDLTGYTFPHPRDFPAKEVMTPDVISCIEIEKLMKPSVYLTELKQRLLLYVIVHPFDLPSKSTISKCMREELNMTKKKIHQIQAESKRDANVDLRDDFLNIISNLEPGTIHCFDESSVIKTTSNRKYGNAPKGKPAFEVQRYASNATYTINLLHSPCECNR
jgi:hypothetical protein